MNVKLITILNVLRTHTQHTTIFATFAKKNYLLNSQKNILEEKKSICDNTQKAQQIKKKNIQKITNKMFVFLLLFFKVKKGFLFFFKNFVLTSRLGCLIKGRFIPFILW